MTIHLPALRADRRTLLTSGLAWLASAVAAHAQDAALTREKLDALIQKTLAEPDTTPLSRARILGFREEKLTTRSIEVGDDSHKHGFMVVIPRVDDGIVLFEGSSKPLFFAVHRTGQNLNRIASVRNQDGALTEWSGAEADAHFASQKAFWAGQV
jgi:hypothetical protein